jgi:molybdopterin molybdotransferase
VADLLSYEEALAIVLSHVGKSARENVALEHLLGRTLAEPIKAPIDLPPFDNSAVDGYALHLQDLSNTYRLVGELPAGSSKEMSLEPGEAARVFTGSRLPQGTKAVIMQEQVQTPGEFRIIVDRQPEPGDHIRKQGEELAAGRRVFEAGTHVNPAVLGMIATLGISEANVAKLPKITVVGTGSELVKPGLPLARGQVYESNTFGIQAALRQMGMVKVTTTTVADEPVQTKQVFEAALESADILILCGGVSVGDYDLVRPTLRALNVEERVWRVRIKPGKPFYFGSREDGKLVFGLPGNPVSALVVFPLFVRPALLKITGRDPSAVRKFLKAATPFQASRGRDEFVRARMQPDGTVCSLEAQGSHMLSGLAAADSLVRIKADSPVRAGEDVEVLPLPWA